MSLTLRKVLFIQFSTAAFTDASYLCCSWYWEFQANHIDGGGDEDSDDGDDGNHGDGDDGDNGGGGDDGNHGDGDGGDNGDDGDNGNHGDGDGGDNGGGGDEDSDDGNHGDGDGGDNGGDGDGAGGDDNRGDGDDGGGGSSPSLGLHSVLGPIYVCYLYHLNQSFSNWRFDIFGWLILCCCGVGCSAVHCKVFSSILTSPHYPSGPRVPPGGTKSPWFRTTDLIYSSPQARRQLLILPMRQLRPREMKEAAKVTELIIHTEPEGRSQIPAPKNRLGRSLPFMFWQKKRIHQPLAGPPGVRDQVGVCLVSPGIHCQIHLELIKPVAAAHFLTWFETKD